MALKPGFKGFLHLGEAFSPPRWREALVVRVEDPWVRTLVRCSREEIEHTGFASVNLQEAPFCLVEAEVHQLRLGAQGDCKTLDCDIGKLLLLGRVALDSDEEINYATATDPAVAPSAARARKPKAAESSSGSSDSEEDGSVLAKEIKKSWLGTGMEGARSSGHKDGMFSSNRKSKRFALIEKTKLGSNSGDVSGDQATQAALKAAVASGDPIQGLLALQLAQTLKGGKHSRRRKSHSSSRSRSSESSASSSSRSSSKAERGHGRAVRAYRRSGKKKFKEPLRHVRRFVKGIESELGAEDRPFKISDYNRRISFGKQQNLKRCHFLVCTILEMLLKEQYHKAALQTVLTLQAIHQAALDQTWDVAWLLTHQEDPFKQKVFGGGPSALQSVTTYLKSMNELARNTEALRKKGSGKGEDGETKKDPDRPKGRGKHKDKEKDKAPAE